MSDEKERQKCDHGLVFDVADAAKSNLTQEDVRKKYPRLDGTCPKCGFYGIVYASYVHYMAGGWK